MCAQGGNPYRDMVFISSPMALLLPDLRSPGLAWDEGPSHSSGGAGCATGATGREGKQTAPGKPFPPG